MIKKSLLLKIFNAACMQRWNDKLRPIELTEMDKQAHKMMIAYFLGKAEEDRGSKINWVYIIEGGIYEYMFRSVVTDIKPPIFNKIKRKKREYIKLINWAYAQWKPVLGNLEKRFHIESFVDYIADERKNKNRNILNVAHMLATRWEYEVLKQFNEHDYEKEDIKKRSDEEDRECKDKGLKGIKMLEDEKLDDSGKDGPLTKLIKLCGELRFQVRWAHIHRMPRTSVLGHLLFVAMITYLISLELKKGRKNQYCHERLYNNFFTALFHDLPEVLTRDIISPVKRTGIDKIIKREEKAQMDEKIMHLLPEGWKDEMCLFTGILKQPKGNKLIDEFENVLFIDNAYNICKTDIDDDHNMNIYKPRDGKIVRTADHLAAFIEAFVAIENGCASGELHEALHDLKSEFNLPQKDDKKPKSRAFDLMREIYSEF
jgi:putative hydrolase of HD superfamily